MNIDEKYFSNITTRERAIFEGAISMGALFHQFLGTPINKKTKKSLEIAIKESIELQPCIEKVEVSINFDNIETTGFEYMGLTDKMLDIKIYSTIKDTTAIIRIKFIEELNYPLMYIEDII